MIKYEQKELIRLKENAISTLQELVTPKGIYASSNKGKMGRFHALFGRDTMITAAFIQEAEKNYTHKLFTSNSVASVLRMARWQGTHVNTDLGEKIGKMPHEIWEDSAACHHLVEGRIEVGHKPFFVDFTKESYVNWFSNDSTPLWIICVLQMDNESLLTIDEILHQKIKNALIWCLENIIEFNGFAGYTYNAATAYYEPTIQSWKDSDGAFRDIKGNIPAPPVKDAGVNAIMWAALQRGGHYFISKDIGFSKKLFLSAAELKKRYNSPEGFLMKDELSQYYFSDALDKNNVQLKGIASDPALALWAQVNGECIIDNKYIPFVVKRVLEPDFLDQEAGIRVYSKNNAVFDNKDYHRGPNTFWPFISGLIGWGLIKFGYINESKRVLQAMVCGVSKFDTCVELFLKKNGKYVLYQSPVTHNTSSLDQSWTAAAIYYALSLALK